MRSDVSRFLFLTFNGLSFGAVYAAVALALVLIWRTTRVLNFAQGAMATATAYVAISVTQATRLVLAGLRRRARRRVRARRARPAAPRSGRPSTRRR